MPVVTTSAARRPQHGSRGVSLTGRLRAQLADDRLDMEGVRTLASAVRLVAAVSVTVALFVDDVPSASTAGLVIAFVWVPASGLLDRVQRRAGHPALDGVQLVVDLGLAVFVVVALDDAAAAVIGGSTLLVGYYTYLRGLVLGGLAVAGCFVMLSAPFVAGHGAGVSGFDLMVAPLALVLASVLMWAVRGERSTASGDALRAREKADAVLTSVAEAVVVTSARGQVREWNDAAERALDCPADAAVATSCADALGLRLGLEELDCSQGCALLKAQLARPEDDLRVWRRTRDGRRQPLLAHVAPLAEDDGTVVEVIHSFRDITSLVQADEAKTLFLATAGHELKTPLTVITGYSELMLRSDNLSPEARRQGLSAIHERARQLGEIVDRILLSSRIEAGRVELELSEVDLGETVDEGIVNLATSVAREIRADLPGDLPLVRVDPAAVRTVFDHLLENALKYSSPDSVVEIRASADDRWVTVEVRDTGIGMTAEEAGQCFDRFWQAESGDVRRYGGTGIGLYIVKSLVDAMRGEVEVASGLGQGSVFTVRLPRADRLAVAPATAGVEAPPPEPSIIREFMRQVGVGAGGGS